MRLLFSVFFLCASLSGLAQSITFFGGMNINDLFPSGPSDFRKSEVDWRKSNGQSFQLNIRPTEAKQSLSILLDHYQAEIYPQIYHINQPDVIKVDKTTLGLGLYPYDLRIFGDLYIQPGADISVLINDKTRLGEKIEYPSAEIKYYDDSLHIANNFQFGVAVIVKYQFNAGNYYITPAYKIYIGGRSEFGKNADLVYSRMGDIFSLRQIFSIGIGRKIIWRKETN